MNPFSFLNLNPETTDNLVELFSREATQSFEDSLKKNFWSGVAGLVFGRQNDLLAFDSILERIPYSGQFDAGFQEIPVERIVGSVGKTQDFDGSFMPRSKNVRRRWTKIARANLLGEYIPPIEVFQVGAVFFVKDGNHRVSVARALNQSTISAHVIAIRIPEAISTRTDLESALETYEREQFFARTRLAETHPQTQIIPSLPGFYRKLLDHISTHHWLMGIKRKTAVSWEEAVEDWLNCVYLPVTRAIQEHRLLAAFPGRTETDLYVWISDYIWYERQATGQKLSYDDAALSFARRTASELQRLLWRVRIKTSK